MHKPPERCWRRWVTAGLCLVLIGSAGCADHILLRPTIEPLKHAATQRRSVRWAQGRLDVLVARSPACGKASPKAYVLGFTGNNGRAEEMIGWMARERWAEFPVEVWMVNYPGFGRSSGPARLDAIVPAALQAYDTLEAQANGRPIFVDGNSFGSVVALQVASVRPASALVLKNPPPLREMILEHYGWWNLFLVAAPLAMQIPAELDATTIASRVAAPAAFLTAEDDTLVPPRYQAYVIDAYAGPKTVIAMPRAQHIDRADADAERRLRRWIHQQWDRTFPEMASHPLAD